MSRRSWFEFLAYDFASFIGKVVGTTDPGATYLPNWHIELIAEYLEAARRGEITRLIINMPPRALKSVCVSVAWPAWILGHAPESRIMAASYASSLAVKHSIDCRNVMESDWYGALFPHTVMAYDQNEKSRFMTSRRGFRLATSVDGATTGEGGNFLILDDPISPMQAMSAAGREHVNAWFDHTFASRLNDKRKGVIVLVMQRLHEDDLSGYLLKKGGWVHLCLPAVAQEDSVLRFGRVRAERKLGEALHAQREDLALIERAKVELGSRAFAAQYLQQPLREENGMVRRSWFRRYKDAPRSFDRVVQSWDTAIKSGQHHDASVCLTFGEIGTQVYLLDAKVMRHEYPELKRMFMAMAAQWQPQAILVEDRASGQQLLQDVRRETHLPVIAMQPMQDKVTRFAAVSALIEAGRLRLPEQAVWLAGFEGEVLTFPEGGHDDQVDALSQYLDWLRRHDWDRLRIRQL